jgi:DNA-binding NtrC family response regulator
MIALADPQSFRTNQGPPLPLAFDTVNPTVRPATFSAMLVGRTVAEVERHLILDTLDHCRGNRTHSAKLLGISIRTLRNKLNEYVDAGICVPEPGQIRG